MPRIGSCLQSILYIYVNLLNSSFCLLLGRRRCNPRVYVSDFSNEKHSNEKHKGTKRLGLRYAYNVSREISCFCDASYASCPLLTI